MLHNNQAWDEAFALEANILKDAEIKINKNMRIFKYYYKIVECTKPYFLCQDLINLNKNKLDYTINEIGKNGHYEYSFKPNNKEFVIGLSKGFRKEWQAYYGKTKLETFSINNSLLGIIIPPNVDGFRLDYRNNILLLLRLISLSVCLILIIVFFKKRKISTI